MAADSDPPAIDPVEALKQIRALVEGSCETTYGTRAEPIIRMIRDILDKALPPVSKRRQKRR
ncbi:hypothetical protein [Methylobacterium sp. ARG-1]|uniref:hypothetical protein n=1 Tax=Methylobacterium sp. ARG-1 TaxID=1692501 RepID=UPI000682F892|nr:hypothetical protein [Methylobacterium sp. ARG-1]KNY24547.1 hypothetical protein AKJ13_00860 [Methylobacterium sp. ARG-1]